MAPTAGTHLYADALVVFGATGDLAFKKLFPALYRMECAGELGGIRIVGVASSDFDDDALRSYATDAIRSFYDNQAARGVTPADGEKLTQKTLNRLRNRIRMVGGDYTDPATFATLRDRLDGVVRPLHYLAIPPSLFGLVVRSLADAGLADGARVVVEKPFGRDPSSAAELNAHLTACFDEPAVFRIDHYLGKASVENLLAARFANLWGQVWDRTHIHHVQITVAEDFGVERRGSFYEGVGAVRDVVQNHLLEVVSLLAMEPPATLEANDIRDEKAKVLRAVTPINTNKFVRGQYAGYSSEAGVDPDSTVETYAAARLEIDNWRWAGVPWLLRTGKRLTGTVTEAVVVFRPPGHSLYAQAKPGWPGNVLRFRLGPTSAIRFGMHTRVEGAGHLTESVELDVSEDHRVRLPQDAYARLLADAIAGDTSRFARFDAVTEAWRVVAPALEVDEVDLYRPGTWGPRNADLLAEDLGGWLNPV